MSQIEIENINDTIDFSQEGEKEKEKFMKKLNLY